ncbi:MAG: hypothetical protein EOP51_14540 [Sphingobacteriales bacterium]|nr:MAG: hypothetical protein EOP51_14540 [Sphingobacteriales bacterium]
MKNFLLAATLMAGTSLALFSCNNGAYDADPSNNNPALNPLDPKSGVTVYLGTMKAAINGTMTEYYPAYYVSPLENTFAITGKRGNDVFPGHTINIGITNFQNLKEFNSDFRYQYKDTTIADTMVTVEYAPKGKFTIVMNGNESGNLRGTFAGTVYRAWPVANLKDSIVITKGEFYVPKKDLPQ